MEPPILKYARFHGVASDHFAADPNSYLQFPSAGDMSTQFDDPNETTQVEDTRSLLAEKINEKLDIGKCEALLLSSVISARFLPESTDSEHGWDSVLPDYLSGRRMKAELPILRTDHELNMLSFRAQISLDHIDLDLPLEFIDDEQDEGLEFPSYCQGLPGQMQERTANEKLDCTRETLRFLEGVRVPLAVSVEDAHLRLYEDMAYYSKVNFVEPTLIASVNTNAARIAVCPVHYSSCTVSQAEPGAFCTTGVRHRDGRYTG